MKYLCTQHCMRHFLAVMGIGDGVPDKSGERE